MLYTIYSMKRQVLQNKVYKKYLQRDAGVSRFFFWRINKYISYTVIILTAYFLTARILAGTADLIHLSNDVAQDRVVHEEQAVVFYR